MTVLIATGSALFRADPGQGEMRRAGGLEDHLPTCLASDDTGRAWAGTREGGVFRSTDRGDSWEWSGLAGGHVTALAADPSRRDLLWAGTEPSALWRSADAGDAWERRPGLAGLPSSSEWAFPPKPETHHVRWIACHPREPGRLWLAIEAGALVRTPDGGATWHDRVAGGPRDTHELAIHPEAPAALRVSAGDGYFESRNGGESWAQPQAGLDVRYLRSVAVDPGDEGVVLVSAASRPRSAYVAGRSDGRVYRREGHGPWLRVTDGWPDPPRTIAPLLLAGTAPGELWAADERGLHRTGDGGRSWEIAVAFPDTPDNLRGLAIVG